MGRMSSIAAARLVKAMGRLGWAVDRTERHWILEEPGHRPVSVPMHRGHSLKPGTARAILKACGVSEDEFFAVY